MKATLFRPLMLALSLCLLLILAPSAHAATLVVLGDSVSAAYGIEQKAGWVELLKQRLQEQQLNYQVINASISGETSAGGRSRIGGLLKQHRPEVVIIALGANDGLRGLPVNALHDNLAYIIHQTRQAGAQPLLVGMRMPPNFGNHYTQAFYNTYTSLAQQNKLAFVPFLMEGIAENLDLYQADGLHPTAAAQPILLDNVWRHLQPLLKAHQ